MNLTVQQQNGSHVLLSWQAPAITNGPIEYYEICYSPPIPPVQVKLNDNGTAHLLTVDFEPGESYSFYVLTARATFWSAFANFTLVFRLLHTINTMMVKSLMSKPSSMTKIWQ